MKNKQTKKLVHAFTERAHSFAEKKKKGVIAVEWTVLAPVIFFVIFASIMYLIFTMDRILYSNASSDLAQELNLGDTGFKSYSAMRPNLTAMVYSTGLMSTAGLANYEGNAAVNIYCTPTPAGEFETAFYYHLRNFLTEGRFDTPFATLESIECRVYNGIGGGSEVTNFSVDPLKTESGDMVEVTVKYKFLFFTITQRGYSFII